MAAIGLGEDWTDQPSEALGFLVMQIARQAKRIPLQRGSQRHSLGG
jgi:hypothetical protein